MELFTDTLRILEKSLDLRMANQRVISSNIANVDTPGYQARRMDFEASLQRAVERIEAEAEAGTLTNPTLESMTSHALGRESGDEAIVNPTGEAAYGLDGNNVNLEAELGQLSNNSLMYQLTARLLSAKMREINTVLEQERR